MKNNKNLFLTICLCILITPICSSQIDSKKLDEIEYIDRLKFYREYFNTSTKNRIKNNLCIKNNQVNEFDGLFVLSDFKGLFSIQLDYNCFSYNYVFYITNEECVKEFCDSILKKVDQKKYIFKSDLIDNSEYIDLVNAMTEKAKASEMIMTIYLSCNLYNRIFFIERYFERINPELLLLFQKDIDTILNTKTDCFIKQQQFDPINFEKAKKEWLKNWDNIGNVLD